MKTIPEGTRVKYTHDGTIGVVVKRTAHTHRAYSVVFFSIQDNPQLAARARSVESKGLKLRVLTSRLEVL